MAGTFSFTVSNADLAATEADAAAAPTVDLEGSDLASSSSDLASSVYGGGESPPLGEANVLEASGVSVDWSSQHLPAL